MGEPPAIPTYFMCRAAKQRVTVMLCGEGADELFGGYSKYLFDQFSAALDWMPPRVRSAMMRAIAGGVPFNGRRVRSIAGILSIADPPRRFGSWYGGFGTPLPRWVWCGSMGDGGGG